MDIGFHFSWIVYLGEVTRSFGNSLYLFKDLLDDFPKWLHHSAIPITVYGMRILIFPDALLV